MQAGQVLGGSEYVTVAELVQTVIDVSGKEIGIEYVEGPVGVHSRNLDKSRSRALGWEAKTSLKEGIAETYAWIEAQADAARIAESADSE
jgi:nucleoside-diphosphate-sugar epimerase